VAEVQVFSYLDSTQSYLSGTVIIFVILYVCLHFWLEVLQELCWSKYWKQMFNFIKYCTSVLHPIPAADILLTFLTFICPCITSISLKYDQQVAMISQSIYLKIFYKLLYNVSGSPSTHHQQHKTVHTAMRWNST
jgi:hypothetical protein